ncbi:hypothetical protein [Streptomyces nanshensis]|uniref:Uncharacterized protein n=1 Tax=Streptomyces nanshensis TaxID=518642 RepID=A0A1E7LCB3_9ACTN|nr:hypothetical protein [Streptomyces nanshensis]OEV13804.1 hypothetical protein AN218_01855 [Streptomyces nanshensis]
MSTRELGQPEVHLAYLTERFTVCGLRLGFGVPRTSHRPDATCSSCTAIHDEVMAPGRSVAPMFW